MKEFYCKTKIISGSGAVAALGNLNIQRLFLVCDPFFYKNGTAQTLAEISGANDVHIFSDVVPNPSVLLAAQGAAAVQRFEPDVIVALGGGSAMDTAKAMAYFSGLHPKLVAIPTTSGSGSEVTDFAILTHDGIKHPLVDERIKPDIAIVDSDLVSSLPPALIADGGFDLISHALEAYVATNAGQMSDLLAQNAFDTALDHLFASFSGDTSVRGKLHLASTLAGIAFSNAGLGLCHAISHSLGGEFHVPHGRLNAVLLPAVIEVNSAASIGKYAQLARNVGLSSGNDTMALRALKNMLLRLRRGLHLPETLLQCGISMIQLQQKQDELIAAALADPCCATNPIVPRAELIVQILREVTGRG